MANVCPLTNADLSKCDHIKLCRRLLMTPSVTPITLQNVLRNRFGEIPQSRGLQELVHEYATCIRRNYHESMIGNYPPRLKTDPHASTKLVRARPPVGPSDWEPDGPTRTYAREVPRAPSTQTAREGFSSKREVQRVPSVQTTRRLPQTDEDQTDDEYATPLRSPNATSDIGGKQAPRQRGPSKFYIVAAVIAVFVAFLACLMQIPSKELEPLMLDSVPDVVKRLRPHVEAELEWSCRSLRRVWLPELLLNRASLAAAHNFSPQDLNQTLSLLLSDGILEHAPSFLWWPWADPGVARSSPCGSSMRCHVVRSALAASFVLVWVCAVYRQLAYRRDSRILAAEILKVLKEEAAGTRRLVGDRKPLVEEGVAKERLCEELLEEFGMKGWGSNGKGKWLRAETILIEDKRVRPYSEINHGEQTEMWRFLPIRTGIAVGGGIGDKDKKRAKAPGLHLSDVANVAWRGFVVGSVLGVVWYSFVM